MYLIGRVLISTRLCKWSSPNLGTSPLYYITLESKMGEAIFDMVFKGPASTVFCVKNLVLWRLFSKLHLGAKVHNIERILTAELDGMVVSMLFLCRMSKYRCRYATFQFVPIFFIPKWQFACGEKHCIRQVPSVLIQKNRYRFYKPWTNPMTNHFFHPMLIICDSFELECNVTWRFCLKMNMSCPYSCKDLVIQTCPYEVSLRVSLYWYIYIQKRISSSRNMK